MTDTLEEARRARLAGRYGAAELTCRRLLDKNPIDALAAGLLGQCLAEVGDTQAGVGYVDLALSLAPKSADVRLNAAALREQQKNFAGAIDEARRAAELDGGKFEAWATLGKLLGQAGAVPEALAALTRACRLNPRHAGAALLLAGAALEVRDYATLRRALDLVDAVAPDVPAALRLRVHLARGVNDWSSLVEVAARWMKKAESEEEPRVALAYGLGQLGYHDRASEIYRPIAEAAPPRAESLAAMGRYRLGARDLPDAKEWLERALAADPNCIEAAFGMSRLLTFRGDFDAAQMFVRRVLATNPRHVEAYGQLAEITAGRLTDAELDQLARLCGDKSLEPDVSAIAHFAYGDALHRKERRTEAFAAWSAANRLKVEEALNSPAGGYNRSAQERTTRRLAELFPGPDPSSAAPADASEAAPIFIVGMPRSGTTLLESAIAAHPLVAAAGEVPALPFLHDEFLAWAGRARAPVKIPEEKRRDWRSRYFDQSAKFRLRPAQIFTDKQPSNFLALGFIRELLPEARIIHIRRNPVETGFSIFRRNFSRQWPFASDLKSIGHYYGQYARLMAHWEAAFAGAFAFVQYETLVENFADEVRRLVAYCGLPWDEACLNFHTAERAVITFSAVQVRKPASKDHLGAAEPYKEHLGPLRDALTASGVDLETGALVDPKT